MGVLHWRGGPCAGTDNETEGGDTKNRFGRLGGALDWGGVIGPCAGTDNKTEGGGTKNGVGGLGGALRWGGVIGSSCAGTDNETEEGGTKKGFGGLNDTATDSSSDAYWYMLPSTNAGVLLGDGLHFL